MRLVPAGAPAAMSRSADRATSLQPRLMVTGPWLPAAGPVMSLVTTSDPGTCGVDVRHVGRGGAAGGDRDGLGAPYRHHLSRCSTTR